MAASPCKRKLLIVDACRNDPRSTLAKSGPPTLELESVTRPQQDTIPEGLVALYSCSEGQKSYEDPDLQHGIFFYELMKAGTKERSTPAVRCNCTIWCVMQ